MSNKNGDRKIAIAKMMTQKQVNKKSSLVVWKKVSIKESAITSLVSSSPSAKQII